MQEYTIELRKGKRSTYCIKEKLKKHGFRYKDKRWYKKTTSHFELFRWKHLRGIQCLVYIEGLHERGKDYRKDYFVSHESTRKDKYHCAYCGRLLPKDELAVDHIIPVQKAQASRFWQRVLSVFCPDGVNDQRNLTTACTHCNSKKGSKAGMWVLRGYWGKHYMFWVFFRITILILIVLWLWFVLFA